MGLTRRELFLSFSEGVALSAINFSALFLSYDDGTQFNASLNCSSAKHGRAQSWREIVLRLDEPCLILHINASSSAINGTTSSSVNASSYFVGGYSSDWEMLTDLGILRGEEGDESTTIDTRVRGVLLHATSDFVADLSAAANPLVAVENLEESSLGEARVIIFLFI